MIASTDSMSTAPGRGQGIMTRVNCYVDDLNLYYGMKQRQWRNYLWLDIPRLARDILA